MRAITVRKAALRFVFPFHFVEQLSDIGFCVVAIGISISCRVHPRLAIEGFHLQTRVIGKDVESITLMHETCFEQSIALESIGSFGDILNGN